MEENNEGVVSSGNEGAMNNGASPVQGSAMETPVMGVGMPVGASEATSASVSPSDWRSALAEDLRDNPVLQKYTTEDSALRGLVSAQAMIGRKGLAYPGATATPEALAEYRAARRGNVRTPQDYPKGDVQELASLGFDEETMTGLRQRAFDAGFDEDAYNAMLGTMVEGAKIERAERAEASNAIVNKLVREWGEDNFGARMQASANFLKGYDGLFEAVDESGLGANETFVRFVDDVVRRLSGEGNLPAGNVRSVADPRENLNALQKSGVFQEFQSPRRDAAQKMYVDNIAKLAAKAARQGGRLEL